MRRRRSHGGAGVTVEIAADGRLVVALLAIKRPGCRFAMPRPIGLLPVSAVTHPRPPRSLLLRSRSGRG
jgi:antitoxin (DNA-binding transcriptional repressor) of toxin-antitoxin stability system